MQNPFDLSGQVAIITGSSKGIGRAAAEIMASLGAKVVVSSRKADACEAVAAGIKKAGGEAIVIPCNNSVRMDPHASVGAHPYARKRASAIRSSLTRRNN